MRDITAAGQTPAVFAPKVVNRDPAVGLPYLAHDPVDLAVLGVDLVAHVQGHVAQVTDDAAHLLQVLVHLIFPGVVCYPGRTSMRADVNTGTSESRPDKTCCPADWVPEGALGHLSPLGLCRA